MPASHSIDLKFTCKVLNSKEMWITHNDLHHGLDFNTPEMTGCRRDGEVEEECHKMAGLLWLMRLDRGWREKVGR